MSTIALERNARRRKAFGLLVGSEIKLARRYPVGLIVSIGLPLVLLVIFGNIPATTRPDKALGGISYFNFYVPTLLVFVLLGVGLVPLPQQLATYRQQGVLRRMSTTPVPPSWLLAAQMTVSLIVAVVGISITIGVGAGIFGLELPHTTGGYLVSLAALILTAAATLGLGLCAAALAGTPQIAQAITGLLFYPLAFFSGLYLPLTAIHSTLINEISKVTPTGAGFNALHATFTGHSPGAEPLLVLASWTVITSVAASRLFRWE
jgi:ABC-2 type transport system permease protein